MVVGGILRRCVLPLLASCALVVTACGSSSKSTSTATTSAAGATGTTSAAGSASTSASAGPLGPSKPATGSAIKIGFVSNGKTQAIDNGSELPAAQATAKYINEHLGGIAGHPVTLDTCEDKATPAGATDCANQMVTDKVGAMLVGADGQAPALYKGVAGGVPFVQNEDAVQNIITGMHAYVLSNALANFVGPAKIAQDAGAKRAAVFGIDVPGVTEPLKTTPFYKDAGVTLDIVPVPPGTPDMTPQVQAELTKNPDQIQVIGDAAFCTSALKAMKTLGFSKTIILIAQCVSPGSNQGIPGGYAGMKEATDISTDPADPGVKLFNAVMAAYSPSTQIVDVTSGAFATVLGFARAMSGLTGDVTPASIEAAFASMSPQPLPLGDGAMFQCDGKQIPSTPAICTTSVLVGTLDASGLPQGGFKTLDVSALLKQS